MSDRSIAETTRGTITVLGPTIERTYYYDTSIDKYEPNEVTIDHDVIFHEQKQGARRFVAVGRQPLSRKDVATLKEIGIGAIVDLARDIRDEAQQFSEIGIDYFGTYVQDTHSPSLEQFDKTTTWIRARLDEGKNVYVHCYTGVGRAPTMATAFLVREGLELDAALQIIERERRVNITLRQKFGLRDFKDSPG